MKALFLAIQAAITANATPIRWVDFDMGQLDTQDPPVSWPCVLVDFSSSAIEMIGESASIEILNTEVVVAFRLRERTHSKTQPAYKEEALEHLDTLTAVRVALTGLGGLDYNGFSRDRRADYRVYRLRFSGAAYPEAPVSVYIPWPNTTGPEFCVHPDI